LGQRLAAVRGHRLGQQRRVLGLLHRLEDQRRIGRRVARRKGRKLLEVAGVGNDGGVLPELFELVHRAGWDSLTGRRNSCIIQEETKLHHRFTASRSPDTTCPSISCFSAAPATSRGAS